MRLTWLIALFATLFATLTAPAAGSAATGASPWERTEFADVRLVSAVAGTEGRDSVPLGLQFRLAEGWKVYWRAPGDAGYPPEVDWQGSGNLAATEMRFPVPSRFSIFGLESYGYKDSVVYPIRAALAEPGQPLTARAEVDALACSDICVPLTASLSLDLDAGPAEPTPFTQLLGKWQSRVPADLDGVGLDIRGTAVVGDPEHPTLEIRVASAEPVQAIDVFPEADPAFSFGRPEVVSAGNGETLLRVPVGTKDGARLDGAPVTLTLVDGERFLERRVIAGEGGASSTATAPPATDYTLVGILGIALLGGLILNLMPCVLPVLSIKLLSVIGQGGAERGRIRAGFLASAAGIVVSFLALAAGAIALQQAGIAVGWGIQFQQPVFLAAMAGIVVLFAANLAGLFEVPLPRFLAALGEWGGGVHGGGHGGGHGLAGQFGTGMLATLLATPCSAPFVGTALGFALSRGAGEITAVFAAMGIGLALPYLAIAALPDLARAMPRPGAWMLWVRRLLAVLLLATAAWLLTVLMAQAGGAAALIVAAALALMLGALAVRRRLGGPVTAAGATLALLIAVAVPALSDRAGSAAGPGSAEAGAVTWAVFDRGALSDRVAAGEVVLVDVTADWCITCKVNKRLVLDAEPVAGLLASEAVVPLRADWTSPDEAISAYLASFGRYGIPFNAVYGPAAPDGIALPELLTSAAVLDAIDRASDGRVARAD